MQLSYYPRRERIGNPELFCGRKEELSFLLKWAAQIPQGLSKSRALMAPKKMGKTALVDRLFNILFVKKDSTGVIPFYMEVPETPTWIADFAEEFYRTFLTQTFM